MMSPLRTRVPSVTRSSVMREVIFGERSALVSASTYPEADSTVSAWPSVIRAAFVFSTRGARRADDIQA